LHQEQNWSLSTERTNVPVASAVGVAVTVPTVAVVERDDMAAVAVDTSAVALPVGLSKALDVVCDFMVNVVGVGALSITHRQIIMFYYLPEPETTKTTGTVLTTTGQVNGRWRILTPHRLETHELTATKFCTIDYIRERTP